MNKLHKKSGISCIMFVLGVNEKVVQTYKTYGNESSSGLNIIKEENVGVVKGGGTF